MKSDQGLATLSTLNDVGKLRAVEGGGRFVLEHSPVGASQSNGVVERQIQSVGGQVRAMKSAIEARWQVDIAAQHLVITWVVEYA